MNRHITELTESLRTGFWAIPALCVGTAVALALGLVAVDRRLGGGSVPLRFAQGPDGAREVLSAITTSMITFTGLVFSITIVVLQLTSSQFSPRVLRTFLAGPADAAVAGCLHRDLRLRGHGAAVGSSVNGSLFVPAVATTVGVLLLLVSVGVFVSYIHHVATSIEASSILAAIATETQAVLEREMPAGGTPAEPIAPPSGAPTAVLPAPESGADRQNALDARATLARSCSAGTAPCSSTWRSASASSRHRRQGLVPGDQRSDDRCPGA